MIIGLGFLLSNLYRNHDSEHVTCAKKEPVDNGGGGNGGHGGGGGGGQVAMSDRVCPMDKPYDGVTVSNGNVFQFQTLSCYFRIIIDIGSIEHALRITRIGSGQLLKCVIK